MIQELRKKMGSFSSWTLRKPMTNGIGTSFLNVSSKEVLVLNGVTGLS
jgi:hypothetical protein